MAAVGPIRLPVHLRVGDTEYEIGHLEIDVNTAPVPGDRFAVAISASTADLRPHLGAVLRAAADQIDPKGGG